MASVFTRLQVNIESLNVSASSMKNVHKFTITCKTTARNIDKILKQINKKLDVINASCYVDDEISRARLRCSRYPPTSSRTARTRAGSCAATTPISWR